MPAIQPARLKKQVADLAAIFDQPVQFVRQLHALLHQYSDHTHRPGQAGLPSPLVGSYNAPPPVMRQVWLALMPLVEGDPKRTLPVCDALWAEPNYDLQLLAARLLGQVPVDPPRPVVERIQAWVQQAADHRLMNGLLENSLVCLQRDAPQQMMELVTLWLASSELTSQQAGLRALLPVIASSGSENMPAIFRLLTPYLRIAPTRLRPDILRVLSALVQISPAETAYVLRQNLSAPDNPDTQWLIRQVLDRFSEETRAGLKKEMKEIGN